MPDYIPDQGDVVWLQFNPQAGHEQEGRRPTLAISPIEYNKKAGLALFCPITSRAKGYPFEVMLPSNLDVSGVILSDQIKSLDWRIRRADFICKVPTEVLRELIKKLSTLLRFQERSGPLKLL